MHERKSNSNRKFFIWFPLNCLLPHIKLVAVISSLFTSLSLYLSLLKFHQVRWCYWFIFIKILNFLVFMLFSSIIYQKNNTWMLNYIQTRFSLHINIFNTFLLPNSYWFLLFKQWNIIFFDFLLKRFCKILLPLCSIS